jgi:hypothetical protein
MVDKFDHSRMNQQQIELRRLLESADPFEPAMRLFLQQHALLHSRKMAATEPWSYEDAVLDGLNHDQIRQAPAGAEHSIAWMIWHIARCEDIAMNLLVAGSPQVLLQEAWLERLKIGFRDTGNAMDSEQLEQFNTAIDIPALRSYRVAVGRRTREIVQQLTAADLRKKAPAQRIQRIWDEGAVVEAASQIVDYWSRQTTAGLLLMPASRHILTHMNEAMQVKRKLKKSKPQN